MLRKLRIALAVIFLVGIVLLFAIPAPAYHRLFGWMAKLQFLPAVMALNVAVIAGVLLATLAFGRIYCSVVCPLGVTQDGVSWLSARRKGKKRRFRYRNELRLLRYGILVAFVACAALGIGQFVVLLAPYSMFGRTLSAIVHPAPLWGNVAVIVAMFLLVMVLAWMGGRTWWCSSVCPVGTVLGLVSRFAAFRPEIDESKCRNCHACEKGCKASCIDIEHHSIDHSRCVDCFDCIGDCRFDALRYRFAWGGPSGRKSSAADLAHEVLQGSDKAQPGPDKGRRAVLEGGAMVIGGAAVARMSASLAAVVAAAGSAGAQGKKLDGGFATVLPKQNPPRKNPLVPFGARGVEDFYRRCTACHLCVAGCPNGVLRPSTDMEHFMKPVMGFENGYCRPECTRCSQVCPAGAILPMTPQQKTAVHIGVAHVVRELCVVGRDGVSCGNCARHCPVGAIMMVPRDAFDELSPMVPAVDEARCIGCGACENLCPSRPLSAIRVDGLAVHITEEGVA